MRKTRESSPSDVTEVAVADVDARAPRLFSEMIGMVGEIRAYLNFATGCPNEVRYLAAYLERDDSKPLRKAVSKRIDFVPLDEPIVPRKREEVFPHEMVFTLADVRETGKLPLEGWHDLWSKLEPQVQLYLGATQANDMYEEHRFLSLIQALEGFHRLFSGNERSRRSRHSESKLKARLEALLDEVRGSLSNLISKPEEFIKCVVDTRNYLSHSAPDLVSQAASGWELKELCDLLASIFEVLTLRRMGFTSEQVKALINRSILNRQRGGVIRFILQGRWSGPK